MCATGIDFPLELIHIWKSKNYAQIFTYSHVNIEKYTSVCVSNLYRFRIAKKKNPQRKYLKMTGELKRCTLTVPGK